MQSPEELAREKIDPLLKHCGWLLQNRSTIKLVGIARSSSARSAPQRVVTKSTICFLSTAKAIGTVEAKPEGYTLTGVEEQSGKYGKNLLDVYGKWRDPLAVRIREHWR